MSKSVFENYSAAKVDKSFQTAKFFSHFFSFCRKIIDLLYVYESFMQTPLVPSSLLSFEFLFDEHNIDTFAKKIKIQGNFILFIA